ncbi:holo-[acyl-carrier-protein] synthase [Nocardioides flavus (ex Wang et al. 2016)]|uniref:Holo-[acyl-carrier-protein] synthase n=1 Tax=Nocardioides flavus (ex Wang et al. 2016) TaxID=2058780 RepID=A0ABQ3HMP1_9ACTN|nr:4'-phosphopantetheinyl transferase superfamily protein [Nocardioides flavus (ex Wang et al. 2016)]GHE18190.1 holo-[acyl-carrier-protein] synthase [Nocardioides flavus (ex Wang et al. 2016)]
MSVIGVGMDVADTRRFDRLVRRGPGGLWAHWYTEAEVRECLAHDQPATAAATRFAVKEASYKALGARFAHEVRWRDIEVLEREAAWRVVLHGEMGVAAAAVGLAWLHVSTCRTGGRVVATVIAETGPD